MNIEWEKTLWISVLGVDLDVAKGVKYSIVIRVLWISCFLVECGQISDFRTISS